MKFARMATIVLGLILAFFPLTVLGVELLDVYRKGEIVLKADPEFGKGQDWEEMFYDLGKDLAVTRDGRIYVTNGAQNNIFEFSKEGHFVQQFGQYGRGPLDFCGPVSPSILDNKYLVVGEYAENKKITLVDMAFPDLRHVKVLKTQYNVWDTIALKNNKIAYLARQQVASERKKQVFNYKVMIKDVVTGTEIPVSTFNYTYNSRSDLFIFFIHLGKQYFPDILISQTPGGELVIGASDQPEIKIYSPEGKKLRSISLQYAPIRVDEDLRDKIQDKLSKVVTGKGEDGKMKAWVINTDLKEQKIIGDYLPYYTRLMVDEAGNFLIFPNTLCNKDCPIQFRVYSPEGKYICTTKINKGNFKFTVDWRRQNFVFARDALYGLFELKNSDDISLRIVKVKYDSK